MAASEPVQNNDPTAVPPEIRDVLAGLRWRIRGYVWLQGLALAATWIGVTFWAALAIDYLPILVGADEMPRLARAVLLAAIAAVTLWILYRWVLRRTFVPLADRSLAILLERRYRDFHDSLITAVELSRATRVGFPFESGTLWPILSKTLCAASLRCDPRRSSTHGR